MGKKSTKKAKPTPVYNSEKETRVLLEQLSSEMKTNGEQYGNVADRLGRIEQELEKHGSIFFKLEFGMEKIQSRVGTIDTKVDRIESELETVKAAVKDVDARIGEKMDAHEQRLLKLEALR